MFRSIKVFLMILVCLDLSGQIVNIEKKRLDTDTTGIYGDVFANIALQRTSKNLVSIGTGGHLSYNFEKSELLLIGELGFVKGGGEKFANDGFLHLRHTATITKYISWESFTQMQYNTLTKIDNRWLTGSGPRFQLTDYDNALFYWSLLYMFEHETLSDPRLVNNDHRFSTYFAFTLRPQETVSFTSTTYVQPRIDLWSDYRLFTENSLSLGISNKLSLNIRFRMTYDRFPPAGIPALTYDMHNGLTYKFR